MMKRTLLAFVVICLCSLSAFAKSLVLTLSDDSKVYFIMTSTDIPVMKFTGDGFSINGENGYTFSQVKSFVISNTDAPNAIDDVKAGAVQMRANTLILSGDAKDIKVYNASGAQVEACVSKCGEQVAIDLNRLDKGVYVINSGKASFKVMKK